MSATATVLDTARDTLVLRFRHLPRHVVRRLWGRKEVRRLGADEAEAVGLYTLVKAAALYDPARGVKPVTYFYKAIAHEVGKVALAGGAIRVPSYQTQPAHHAYGRRYAADVARAFNYRGLPRAWDAQEPAAPEPPDPLLAAEDRERVRKAIRLLPPRWRQVVRLRFGVGGEGPMTLQQVGDRLGCTRENVRQTEQKALARLRQLLAEDG
jgi:RNA polymerase sigma factor (sigma-70 family)